MDTEQPQIPPPPQDLASALAPQVRSRVTVVCGECKRLKLKCDRRNPCGSCMKRDTTDKCIYSTAAAEKVDLASLNNRLILVESYLAQISGGEFTSSYPLTTAPPPPPHNILSTHSPIQSATLAFPFEELAALWLDGLHLDVSIPMTGRTSAADAAVLEGAPIKMELPAHDSLDTGRSHRDSSSVEQARIATSSMTAAASSGGSPFSVAFAEAQRNLPPLALYRNNSSNASEGGVLNYSPLGGLQFPRSVQYSDPGTSTSTAPTESSSYVSPALLAWLPPPSSDPSSSRSSPSTRPQTMNDLLCLAEQSARLTFPSLDWKQFRLRAVKMRLPSPSQEIPVRAQQQKIQRAREIMLSTGPSSSRPSPAFLSKASSISWHADEDEQSTPESLAFYAAVSAALALGAYEVKSQQQYSKRNGKAAELAFPSPPRSASSAPSANPYPLLPRDRDAMFWYALSSQALDVYDATLRAGNDGSSYDYTIEYLWARLLQIRFLLHAGPVLGPTQKDNWNAVNTTGLGNIVVSMIGDLVNVARQMGLHKDPDDCINDRDEQDTNPSASQRNSMSHLEAEMRRWAWWDIFYCDVFISDALGRSPAIASHSYTTKYPMDGIEESSISSTSQVPSARSQTLSVNKILEVRSSLAALVCNTKDSMCRGSQHRMGRAFTFDQASSLDADIRAWLQQLPPSLNTDLISTEEVPEHESEAAAAALRCEISIAVHRLIMRLYHPFCGSITGQQTHQASLSMANAAHAVVQAVKNLQVIWTVHGRVSSLSPALFDLYSLGRTALDCAVICGHTAITQPNGIMALPAVQLVADAAAMLQSDEIWMGPGCSDYGQSAIVSREDAVKIVDALQAKIGSSRVAGSGNALKRKHEEVERKSAQNVPQAPSTADIQVTSSNVIQLTSPEGPSRGQKPTEQPRGSSTAPSGEHKDKKAKNKKSGFGGFRNRPGKDVSMSSPQTPISTDAASPVTPMSSVPSGQLLYSEKPPSSSGLSSFQSQMPQPPNAYPDVPPLGSSSSSVLADADSYRSRSSSISQDRRFQPPLSSASMNASYASPTADQNVARQGSMNPPSSPVMHYLAAQEMSQHPTMVGSTSEGYASESRPVIDSRRTSIDHARTSVDFSNLTINQGQGGFAASYNEAAPQQSGSGMAVTSESPQTSGYRSRSASIARDPRLQYLVPDTRPVGYPVPYPPQGGVGESGQVHQQVNYKNDSVFTDYRQSAPSTAAYQQTGPFSPYGNDSSGGPLSAASSPYTSTSNGTPVFGNGPLPPSHSSPGNCGQPTRPSPPYYGNSGYDQTAPPPAVNGPHVSPPVPDATGRRASEHDIQFEPRPQPTEYSHQPVDQSDVCMQYQPLPVADAGAAMATSSQWAVEPPYWIRSGHF